MLKKTAKNESPAIQVVEEDDFEILRRYQETYLIQESKNKYDALR